MGVSETTASAVLSLFAVSPAQISRETHSGARVLDNTVLGSQIPEYINGIR